MLPMLPILTLAHLRKLCRHTTATFLPLSSLFSLFLLDLSGRGKDKVKDGLASVCTEKKSR